MNFKAYYITESMTPETGQHIPDMGNLKKLLSRRVIDLIDKHNIVYDETLKNKGSAGGLGIAEHGEKGPHIYYPKGDLPVALHEIGHAMTLPYDDWTMSEFSRLGKRIGETVQSIQGLHFNTSNYLEAWADTFRYYHMPWKNLLLRGGFPDIWNTMKENFSVPAFYVQPSDEVLSYAEYRANNRLTPMEGVPSRWKGKIDWPTFSDDLPRILMEGSLMKRATSWKQRMQRTTDYLMGKS